MFQLEHKDSMGNGSVIHRAEVQRMSAGTGVTHSEFNPSKTEKTHLLQIWFLPEAEGLPPGYEQKAFDMEQAKDSLLLVASRKGLQGSVHLNQSVKMYLTRPQNQPVSYTPEMGRGVWVHLATGQGKANNQPMKAGDAVAVTQEESVELTGDADSLFVLFDVEISGR